MKLSVFRTALNLSTQPFGSTLAGILRQFTGELTGIYQQIERSEIKELEQHLSKLTYKIAVELAQIHMLSL